MKSLPKILKRVGVFFKFLKTMKKLELQNFDVVEMDAKEMKETDGGILGLLTLPIAGWVAGFMYEKTLQIIKN